MWRSSFFDFFNWEIIKALLKFNALGVRLISEGPIFWEYVPFPWKLATLLLLSNVGEQ